MEQKNSEGVLPRNQNVVLIEDVITSGNSVQEAAKTLGLKD